MLAAGHEPGYGGPWHRAMGKTGASQPDRVTGILRSCVTVNQLASLCLILSSGKGGDSHRGSSRGYKINWVIHRRAWVGAWCRLTLLFGPPRLLWLLLLLLFSLRGDQRYGGVGRYDYRVGMREQRRWRNAGGHPVTPDAPSATPVLVLLVGWDLILPFCSENTWGLAVSREDKRGQLEVPVGGGCYVRPSQRGIFSPQSSGAMC